MNRSYLEMRRRYPPVEPGSLAALTEPALRKVRSLPLITSRKASVRSRQDVRIRPIVQRLNDLMCPPGLKEKSDNQSVSLDQEKDEHHHPRRQ